jgi:hypothetical protein
MGIVRSGSTWAFNVCRELIDVAAKRGGLKASSGFLSEADLEQWVANCASLPANGAVVIKAHDIGAAAAAAVRSGMLRAVCTIRDPRDCVVSDVALNNGWLDASIRRVSANLANLAYHRAAGNTLFVRYEQMMANSQAQVERIADHLGVDLDPLTLGRIDAKTNLQAARATAAGLRHRRPEDVRWCDDRRVDPVTQLHENHIRTGRTGGWRDELLPDEQAYLTDVFYPWLAELGYEPQRTRSTQYA